MSTVNLNVPERQPFEGNATQRQKQKIWDLGFRDEELIKSLGKRQASSVIDQLQGHHETEAAIAARWGRLRRTKRYLLLSLLLPVVWLGFLLLGKFAPTVEGIATTVSVVAFIAAVLLIPVLSFSFGLQWLARPKQGR